MVPRTTDLRPGRGKWAPILAPVFAAGLLAACESLPETVDVGEPAGQPVLLAAADGAETGGYLLARSPYGHYLAGRHADRQRDLSLAADFMLRALELDPDNPQLLARAFALAAGDGRNVEAVELAKRVVEAAPQDTMARLVLAVDAVLRGDYPEAETQLAAMPTDLLGQVVSIISGAWIALGDGRKQQALERVNALAAVDGFEAVYHLQMGLLLDVAGDTAAAEADYDKAREVSGQSWLRLAVLAGNAYERLGHGEKAEAAYREVLSRSPETTFFDSILARLSSGARPEAEVANPDAGLAESLFNLGSVLGRQRREEMALAYTHLALRLRPNFDAALVLKGEILQQQERGAEAIAAYESISEDSPYYWSVQLRIAEELGRQERIDDAVSRFDELAARKPEHFEPLYYMGNLLRTQERFAEAVVAYDRALERIGEPQARHWSVLYFRGIALERTDAWDRAEADFLRALEFEPEQPYVMNYLAYSWVEKKMNLEKAKGMLYRAVELRPDDGYIVDSLGWVYYRVGEYENAVRYLERAVELRPHDPVINDHLGDAYWKVGRKAEARFQWRRALSFEPEEELVPTIESKLDIGLQNADNQNI